MVQEMTLLHQAKSVSPSVPRALGQTELNPVLPVVKPSSANAYAQTRKAS